MHKLFAKQLAKATKGDFLDKIHLSNLVSKTYEEFERDRSRTDHTIAQIIEENEQLNLELQANIKKLAVQNSRFNIMLENMSHGLCMFDGNNCLVVANCRFADLFQLPPQLKQVGVQLRQILTYAVHNGILEQRETKSLLTRSARALSERGMAKFTLRPATGQVIETTLCKVEDGGWVAVCNDVTEQHQAEIRIRHMARHDSLTDLPNRLQFQEVMEYYLPWSSPDEKIAILSLDLDHFKSVNDTLGHPIGDKLLIAVAARLKNCVRNGDVIARLGGDEFSIIQVGMPQPEAATSLAHRIVKTLSIPYVIEGHQIVIGASVGITVAPTDGQNAGQLLKNADLALYRAKEDGRGTVRTFEPEMDARVQARRTLEFDLRQALIHEEFELYYQPQIAIATHEIIGFEALIRWNHPKRGLVAPIEFIPLAEETGMIVPIGEWVLKQACLQATSWSEPIKIAVNLSPIQFKCQNLVASVVDALDESGLEPPRLELEITESAMLEDTEHTINVLREFHELGVRVSLDDFGTGYSSLSYLRRFPFDKIKIDQSFIYGLGNADDALAIVRAVTGLSNSLGIVTTAEGVETVEQLSTLCTEGCTEAQGYLISPPRPASEVEMLLKQYQKPDTAKSASAELPDDFAELAHTHQNKLTGT